MATRIAIDLQLPANSSNLEERVTLTSKSMGGLARTGMLIAALAAATTAVAQDWSASNNATALTDEKPRSLTNEALAVEEAEVAMKKKYLERLSGVIPATKAVRSLQMENKIRALVRFDLAANLPLVD